MLTSVMVLIDGEEITACMPAIPRVGDFVNIPDKAGDSRWALVTRVEWDGVNAQPTVYLHAEWE